MALECACDWDAVIATFDHPRYELVGTDTVFDGEDAVRAYFKASRTPFPDQGNEIIALRQTSPRFSPNANGQDPAATRAVAESLLPSEDLAAFNERERRRVARRRARTSDAAAARV